MTDDGNRTRALAVASILLLVAVGSAVGPASGSAPTGVAAAAGGAHTVTPTATPGATPTATPSADGSGVAIVTASVVPSTVATGTTVDQRVTVYAIGVSADGKRDTTYVAFPNAVASNLSVAAATATRNATVVSTALVDGADNDGVADTVAVETDATGGGTIPLIVTVNVSTRYPEAGVRYRIDARIVDSTGATATERGAANVTTTQSDQTERTVNVSGGNESVPPVITDFRLNATQQDVDVVVGSTEDLEKLKVKVKGKTKNVTLTRADFTETTTTENGTPRFFYDQDVDVYLNNTSTGDVGKLKVKVKSKVKKIRFARPENGSKRYIYRADVSDGQDGTFDAELVEASSEGEAAVVGQRDRLTVSTFPGPDLGPVTAGFVLGLAAAALGVLVHRRRDRLAAWLSSE